jgi:hypothetical protein
MELLPRAAMRAFGKMPEMSYLQLARMEPTTMSVHRVLAIYERLTLQKTYAQPQIFLRRAYGMGG